MAVRELGVPVDVLWFRLPKPEPAPPTTLAYLDGGDIVLTIDRGDYYQGGMLIPKGGLDRIRAAGLPALRERLVRAAPVLRDVVGALRVLGPGQAAVGAGQPARRWHRPGPAVHRRRRARHVAGLRGRGQLRRAGRHRHGQPAGGRPAPRPGADERASRGCSGGGSCRCG